jgi:hypothetical protein
MKKENEMHFDARLNTDDLKWVENAKVLMKDKKTCHCSGRSSYLTVMFRDGRPLGHTKIY